MKLPAQGRYTRKLLVFVVEDTTTAFPSAMDVVAVISTPTAQAEAIKALRGVGVEESLSSQDKIPTSRGIFTFTVSLLVP